MAPSSSMRQQIKQSTCVVQAKARRKRQPTCEMQLQKQASKQQQTNTIHLCSQQGRQSACVSKKRSKKRKYMQEKDIHQPVQWAACKSKQAAEENKNKNLAIKSRKALSSSSGIGVIKNKTEKTYQHFWKVGIKNKTEKASSGKLCQVAVIQCGIGMIKI